MKDKKLADKKIEYWLQLYLQAKVSGNVDLMKKYGAILLKLGQKLPK